MSYDYVLLNIGGLVPDLLKKKRGGYGTLSEAFGSIGVAQPPYTSAISLPHIRTSSGL